MNTKENSPARPDVSTLKTTTFAKPVTSSLKREMSSTEKLNCQLPSSGYLFHYPENNQTARSAAFPRTPTRIDNCVCITLVLTLVIVALTSVGCLFKDRRVYHMTRSVPDAFVTVCSVDDKDCNDGEEEEKPNTKQCK